jgi:hypothetical protein
MSDVGIRRLGGRQNVLLDERVGEQMPMEAWQHG